MNVATVILAAGLGTRMKSQQAKVLHRVAGRPMVEYAIAAARAAGSTRVVAILGHQHDKVRAVVGEGIEVALQHEQKGTGHAVQQAASLLKDFDGLVMITMGDTPLIKAATLKKLIEAASDGMSMIVNVPPDPKGYGRIVRDASGAVQKIVEEKDCTEEQRKIREANAGLYCGPARFIFESLANLKPNNAQGELYLTDVIERAAQRMPVRTVEASDEEVMGVNDRVDLARADKIMRLRLAEDMMRAGVTIREPGDVYLEPGITVGKDSELGPGVELRGKVTLGERCRVEAGSIITDATIGNDVHIKPYCVISESTVGNGVQIGPWMHMRPGSTIEDDVHLGNFVETKKTRMGRGAKANHLSYLGDADIGAKVNVGCGTITCNYDGYAKYKTIVEEGAFIGSDTQLVAPVRVGAGAVVAAGTTVTRDVQPGALVLTRADEKQVPGYAEKKRKKMKEKGLDKKSGG